MTPFYVHGSTGSNLAPQLTLVYGWHEAVTGSNSSVYGHSFLYWPNTVDCNHNVSVSSNTRGLFVQWTHHGKN